MAAVLCRARGFCGASGSQNGAHTDPEAASLSGAALTSPVVGAVHDGVSDEPVTHEVSPVRGLGGHRRGRGRRPVSPLATVRSIRRR